MLTLKLTNQLAKEMNSLREQYFPKHLNRTPAHLTLFHALPDSQFAAIDGGISELSANTKIFYLTAGTPFRMRQGVGIQVDKGYNNVKKIRAELQNQWMSCLSEQDAGGSRPHWTVMNKVRDQKKIDDAFEAVARKLEQKTWEGDVTGLDLWRYDPSVTEMAAGSGLFVPTLFDDYRAFTPRPAAFFVQGVVGRLPP